MKEGRIGFLSFNLLDPLFLGRRRGGFVWLCKSWSLRVNTWYWYFGVEIRIFRVRDCGEIYILWWWALWLWLSIFFFPFFKPPLLPPFLMR